jgi:Nuclear cap-binding protein subunit 3
LPFTENNSTMDLSHPRFRPVLTSATEGLSSTAAFAVALEQRSAQHFARAERFGMPTVSLVRDVSVLGGQRAGFRGGGFVTGFDITAPEQAERRAARSQRFATSLQAGDKARNVQAASSMHGDGGAANALQMSGALGSNGPVHEERPIMVADVDPLENRRAALVGESVRPSVLHVFGVDEMSTTDIRSHFLEYGPSWIEWINDSSCNVTFEDEFTASRVLTFMDLHAAAQTGDSSAATIASSGLDDAPADMMGEGEHAGLSAPVAPVVDPNADPAIAAASQLPSELEWRPAVPFKMNNNLLPLWMRAATDRDARPARPNPMSRWARSVVGPTAAQRLAPRRLGTTTLLSGRPSVRDRDRGRERERVRTVARRRRVTRGDDDSNNEGVMGNSDSGNDIAGSATDGSLINALGAKQSLGERMTSRLGMKMAKSHGLGVRGGSIAKARSRKVTAMDIDRALDS